MCRFLSALVVALVLCSDARANWKYTRWYMSPHDVVVASNSLAFSVPPEIVEVDGRAKLLESSIDIEGISLKVAFIFTIKSPALVTVALYREKCTPAEAYKLERLLTLKYGSPLLREGVLTMLKRTTWKEQPSGDIITFISLTDSDGTTCTIRYEPTPANL